MHSGFFFALDIVPCQPSLGNLRCRVEQPVVFLKHMKLHSCVYTQPEHIVTTPAPAYMHPRIDAVSGTSRRERLAVRDLTTGCGTPSHSFSRRCSPRGQMCFRFPPPNIWGIGLDLQDIMSRSMNNACSTVPVDEPNALSCRPDPWGMISRSKSGHCPLSFAPHSQ